jgi:pyruvate kinase
MALRNSDIREIQGGLASLGLSSLGRTEAHTLASISAVLRVLQGMARGQPAAHRQQAGPRRSYDFEAGNQQLQKNTEALLGPKPKSRNARIMVTMPAEVSGPQGEASPQTAVPQGGRRRETERGQTFRFTTLGK